MSSVDNLCKQFGPRSGPQISQAWSGSKLFNTMMVSLKELFKKDNFWKKSTDDLTYEKLPSMQRDKSTICFVRPDLDPNRLTHWWYRKNSSIQRVKRFGLQHIITVSLGLDNLIHGKECLNQSSGSLTMQNSKQHAQLQRLDSRILTFTMMQF